MNSENRGAIHYLAENHISNGADIRRAMGKLIKEGADLNLQGNSFNYLELVTPLQIVVGAEKEFNRPNLDYELITRMVESGADIHQSNGYVPSALADYSAHINMAGSRD